VSRLRLESAPKALNACGGTGDQPTSLLSLNACSTHLLEIPPLERRNGPMVDVKLDDVVQVHGLEQLAGPREVAVFDLIDLDENRLDPC
jgi:hypothetical protein